MAQTPTERNPMAHELYNQLSKYTDASYRRTKNYEQEVAFMLRRVGKTRGRRILIDVACGSGGHAELLCKAGFDVYAVDLNQSMLRLLKKNIPTARSFRQDMKELNVPVQADLLICMFNSINYIYSYAQLRNTLQRFFEHLKPGGVVVFDSAFFDDTWIPGPFSVETTTTPEFEMARVNKSYRNKNFGIVEIVFVVFAEGKKKIVETRNKIFLPARKRIVALMRGIGFETELYSDFSDKQTSGTVSVFVGRKPARA